MTYYQLKQESNTRCGIRRAARTGALLLLCLFLCFTATGCSLFGEDGIIPEAYHKVVRFIKGNDVTSYDKDPNAYDAKSKTESLDIKSLRPQGSAKELRGDVILIGIYVDEPSDPWKEDDLAIVRSNMKIATAWLEKQAKAHDVDLAIHFAEPNTVFHIHSDKLPKDAATSKINFDFNDELSRFVSNLDISDITEKYGTDNVGYLLFLHEDYGSYTWPYTRTGVKLDRYFYYESCCLFLYDGTGFKHYDNPATYAHEILHLFGACDLYEENLENGVDRKLLNYIKSEYPNELMYYTYEEDDTSDYEKINKELSPFTLYYLGWEEAPGLLDKWPKIKREEPAAFNKMRAE